MMEIEILEDYSFLQELVKDGQLDPSKPFLKDGLCFASKCKSFVYVFHFDKDVIWATYGYAKVKNKSFLKFHKIVSNIMFRYNRPILRIGANNDFKNHTKLFDTVNNIKIYEFIRD